MTPQDPIAVPPERWAALSAELPRPWTREAVLTDLAWWQAQGRVPGRRAAQRRWGWPERATRAVLQERRAWLNRRAPAPVLSPRPGGVPASLRGACPRVTHVHLSPALVREVRAIARATRAYRSLVQAGADRDDVEQEVLARVVARADAFVPERGSTGRYLRVLVGSLVAHLAEEQRAAKRRAISVGALGWAEDGTRVEVDAAQVAVAAVEERDPVLVAIDEVIAAVTSPRRPSLARVRRLLGAVARQFEAGTGQGGALEGVARGEGEGEGM